MGFSSRRDCTTVRKVIHVNWFCVHGPPTEISADPEFENADFRHFCASHNVKLAPRPARRHNKIGIVESSNEAIRYFVQRLLNDREFATERGRPSLSDQEIVANAAFLKNLLSGSKLISSFELAKGYTPSMSGLPDSPSSIDFFSAYLENSCRRALHIFLRSKNTKHISRTLLAPGTPVYFYRKSQSRGAWFPAFVKTTKDHLAILSSTRDLKGTTYSVSYEDLRLQPSSPLLRELERLELGYTELPPSREEVSNPKNQDVIDKSSPQNTPLVSFSSDPPMDQELDQPLDFSEWSSHPRSVAYLSNTQVPPHVDQPSKDIGHTLPSPPPPTQPPLKSASQKILQTLMNQFGSGTPLTEHKLQCAPRWLLDQAIEKEKKAYLERKAYAPVQLQSLPRNANLISSHHFFVIKHDGDSDTLKLKCRLVPHGNRDKEKNDLRSDSATAQFPAIRLLLSLTVLLQFSFAALDIKLAYLQAETSSVTSTYALPEAGQQWPARYGSSYHQPTVLSTPAAYGSSVLTTGSSNTGS